MESLRINCEDAFERQNDMYFLSISTFEKENMIVS